MKRRHILAWPLVVMPLGTVSLIEFVKRIAPHLSVDEMTFVQLFGCLAILCFSMMGAFLFWLVMQFYHGWPKDR
jgi:hypothetical protein